MKEVLSLSEKIQECHRLRSRSMKCKYRVFAYLAMIVGLMIFAFWRLFTLQPVGQHPVLSLCAFFAAVFGAFYCHSLMLENDEECERCASEKRKTYYAILEAGGAELIDDLTIEFRSDWKDLSKVLMDWALADPERRFDALIRKLRSC